MVFHCRDVLQCVFLVTVRKVFELSTALDNCEQRCFKIFYTGVCVGISLLFLDKYLGGGVIGVMVSIWSPYF